VPSATGASAELQRQLNTLVTDVLGADRAVVVANVALDQRRSSATSLTYTSRGITLASRVDRTRASGYRRRRTSAARGHDTKRVSTTFAPGTVRRIDLGVIVDSTVPRATVAALRRELAAAAGLKLARGDRITVTRAPFAVRRASTASPLASTAVRSALRTLRWLLLGAGAVAFAWLSTLRLYRQPLADADRSGSGHPPSAIL
jgi:flagellar biosynthesis/type III secretory pathway M-ring protein FliF/YscJ